jgi:hypothetical protein
MTLRSFAHEALRAAGGFAIIMLVGAVLPIAAVALLAEIA